MPYPSPDHHPPACLMPYPLVPRSQDIADLNTRCHEAEARHAELQVRLSVHASCHAVHPIPCANPGS
jgi:hypothetical protein